jgi:murein DD-endopeptidase MepM/ murein hydrolase activator NlpD
MIFFYPTGHAFSSLVGADVDAKPGPAKLLLTLIHRTGAAERREVMLKIKARAFHTESFSVPAEFDQMSPEALEEVRREQAAFAKVFAAPSVARLWEGSFIRPVSQEASATSFGSRRIINGVARAPHSGADLAAPAGTEVLASNHGRVALVGTFFFAGGSVVLDHGAGLFTMYFHLSDPRVEEGAMAKKGEVIGLSGASGRVTGPHLHWGARLANARIDPFELIKKISAAPVQAARPERNVTEKIYGTERSAQ